jgi:tetratricopeptide (TPR) repeat protein
LRWLRAEKLIDEYLTGWWDEALPRLDEFLAEAEAGRAHYMDAGGYIARANIRLARGDEAGALADSERALELGREAQDPQAVNPPLAYRAHVLLAVGRQDEAAAVTDELLERASANRSSFVSLWAIPLAIVLVALGRGRDFDRVVEGRSASTRWLEAACAYSKGDFAGTADMLGEMGALPEEAFVRLRSAEALVEAGRRADADVQLDRALAFYRSVDATAYIREAEALFAASA